MVDYNQSLSVPEAIKRCAALDGEGLTWIEEPTQQDDYAGHAQIALHTRTAVQLGENWYGIAELNNPPAKAGGLGLRAESPDTRRLNDASYSGSIFKSSVGLGSKWCSKYCLIILKYRMASVSVFHVALVSMQLILAAKADRLKPVVSTLRWTRKLA